MKNSVGIDFGASVIRVANADDGILTKQPSLLLVDKQTARILALGEEATELATVNRNAVVMRPFSRGLLARRNVTKYVLNEVRNGIGFSDRPITAALSIPCDFSRESAGELLALMQEAGFHESRLVYSPVAAMTGCNIPPDVDCIFVDIGAVNTSIVLFLAGKMTYTDTLPVAGEQLDRAIMDYMVSEKRIRITQSAAETLKHKIGLAWNDGAEREVRISGENVDTGRNEIVTVSSTEVMGTFTEAVEMIVEHVCNALRRVPLNRVESLFRNGIYIAGGGALLDGFDKLIHALTGVHAYLVPQAEEVGVLGLAHIAALDSDKPQDAALISRLAAFSY